MHSQAACIREREAFAMCHNSWHHAGFRQGVVSTGNSLDYTDQCMMIMNEHGAVVKEMEAAAVAEVCRDHGIPFTAVKAVTDIVDGGKATEVEFLENLGKAVDALKDALCRLLAALDGKTLEEL
jgi:5'-methylthioadenosine nucleosidase